MARLSGFFVLLAFLGERFIRYRRRAKRYLGFTVVELSLSVAIVGTIATIGPTLMIQVTRYFRQNQARTEIQRDARFAFDLMGRTLRQARASTVIVSFYE